MGALGVGSLMLLPAVSVNAQGLRSNVATITLRVSKPQESGTEEPLVARDADAALPPHWATADDVHVEIDPAPAAAGQRASPRFFVRDAFGRFALLQMDSGVLVGTGVHPSVVSFRVLVPATLPSLAIAVRYVARWGRGPARIEQLQSVISFPSPRAPAP
jgi:hypothetical protein